MLRLEGRQNKLMIITPISPILSQPEAAAVPIITVIQSMLIVLKILSTALQS